MKEKIAELFAIAYQKGIRTEPISCPDLTKETLSLLKEEIEKVKNPYSNETNRLLGRWDNGDDKKHPFIPQLFYESWIQKNAFDNCRQAILKALES